MAGMERKSRVMNAQEKVIIAHHDTVVQSDDHVILFLSDRRHLEAVEKLFLRQSR